MSTVSGSRSSPGGLIRRYVGSSPSRRTVIRRALSFKLAAAANPVIVSHRRPDVSFAPLDIAMLVAIE
jgi:hypothetical protein